MPGWHHTGRFKPKECVVCGVEFTPTSGVNKFCSTRCKGKWKYINGDETTEGQYKRISGNWNKYFLRLRNQKHRDLLSVQDLMFVLESQSGKCALSGVQLTCTLVKGDRCQTNASIDRITPGGLYIKSNVQLVCAAVNRWRSDTPVDDFVNWCRLVTEYNDKKTQLP